MATHSMQSLIAVTTIFFSQLFVPSLGADVCTPGKGCHYVDEKQVPIKYLFVGNPGTGKSTMLNGLAGEPLFEAGVSFGAGKTAVLQREKIGKDTYMDTPGLSDVKLREQAAREITDALNDGGAFKVIFVMTVEAGRVRPADRTTMELILGSAPISHYGVMINKLSKKSYKMLLENTDGAYDAVVTGLMTDLPTKSLYFHFKEHDVDLDDETNKVPKLDEDFVRFIQNIPAVEIKPEDVKAINANAYAELEKKLEGIIAELYKDKKLLQEKMDRDHQEHLKLIQDMQQRSDKLVADALASTSGNPWQTVLPLLPLAVQAFQAAR